MRMRARAAAGAAIACGCAFAVLAQTAPRRVATVTAVRAFPGFYHGQPVLVRGELRDTERPPVLASGEETIRVIARDVPRAGTYDVRGEVIDVGRLTADDPRVSQLDLRALGIDPADRWPRQGEVVVLRASGFEPAQALAAPSVRNLALDPGRYLDQRVTVAGQFRGRNLYGDLPQAPSAAAQSKGEFVIRSADAAIWVLGKRPKGRGFDLDPESRIDTRRWLEVSGVVHEERGLVWIEAQELNETEAQKETAPVEAAAPPPAPIPPEVLFSAPTQDETDVPGDTRVRIQFSRDIKPESFRGRVRVAYASSANAPPPEPIPEPQLRYDPAARVLDIEFQAPLQGFRPVVVQLLDGIVGTDGAPLAPWTLRFTTGR